MSPCQVVVMRHWRSEVDDVVDTLRDSHRRRGGADALQLSSWPAGLIKGASARNGRPVYLFSDTAGSRLLSMLSADSSRPKVFRLWWNDSTEIAGFAESPPARTDPKRETHIGFFPESVDGLPGSGLNATWVPYAFSKPRTGPPGGETATIYYTGEVDVSADCFAAVIDDPVDAEKVSAAAWDSAESVVAGRLSLVAVGRDLKALHGIDRPDVYRTAMWSIRNRTRFLVMKAIQEAFPGRLVIRGSDWRRHGFDASSTRFLKAQRMAQYRKHRVSLDLGSKSTDQLLYPRSADIMAAGGGIVTFDTGVEGEPWSTALESRRASSIDGLVGIVDRLLSAPEKSLADENDTIRADYSAKRLQVGTALGEKFCSGEAAT